uniref:DUF4283 domain-containing protein n=1 Tax=Cannabis sativa TaxID=3483 RepID=A0A803QQP0_CANSA
MCSPTFHDPCKELDLEEQSDLDLDGNSASKIVLNSLSWAEEVEEMNFQSSAKDTGVNLKQICDMDVVKMVRSVPVWIRLNGLGLQYWGKNNLSAMVSTIDKPIMVDKVT